MKIPGGRLPGAAFTNLRRKVLGSQVLAFFQGDFHAVLIVSLTT